jgi:cellobiose-specific phosphotransferase system component IIC
VSAGTRAAGQPSETPTRLGRLSAGTLGVLAVVGLVVAFSLSSTLVKRAESPGVLVAFWRMVAVSVVWNVVQGSSAVADAARDAFVDAMSRASIVVALVAALGAFVAWRHLPAREGRISLKPEVTAG